MLDYRVGDVFEWDTPAGKASLRVDEILYQPESAGVYDKSGYLSRVRSTAPEYYFIKAPINCGALLLLANALSE